MSETQKTKKTTPLRIAVSTNLYEYLGVLARTTTLGGSENDVALQILTERLEVMRLSSEYAYTFKDEN